MLLWVSGQGKGDGKRALEGGAEEAPPAKAFTKAKPLESPFVAQQQVMPWSG